MFNRAMVVVLALVLAGALGSCSSSDGGEDVECIRDTDCAEGEICRNAVCVDSDDPCLLVECDPGYRCQDGECVPVDPCADMVCDNPPGDQDCYQLPGTCSAGVCDYTALTDGSDCDDGDLCTLGDVCAAGTCVGEALVCEEPPASACQDGVTLRVYEALGQCRAGECDYAYTDQPCEFQCLDDSCRPQDYCNTLNAMRCLGAMVQRCDGSSWQSLEDCSTTDLNCEMVEGLAQCAPFVCAEGESRCTGLVQESCEANRWVAARDCGAEGLGCVDGACQACEPQCQGLECGPDGCGGSCGDCAEGLECFEGSCASALCPEGQSCDPTYNGASTCLVDGLPPEESPSCDGGYTCPPGLVCAIQEPFGNDGYRCMAFCGVCPDGLECGPSDLVPGLHVCLDQGQVPELIPCEPTDQVCMGNQLCLPVDGNMEQWGCFDICSAPPCEPQCDGLECGPDGCGGLCGSCAEGVECVDGQCLSLCPAGLSCVTSSLGEITVCLDDGQIPADAVDCGTTACSNDEGCFPDQEGSGMHCLEICGVCPEGETCDVFEVASDWTVHLCMVDGMFPSDAPACDSTFMCEGNAVCVSDGANYVCANACSGPHP